MKITREQLKGIVRETMIEENEYQQFFKKALEKTGKSIPQMSDEEKKAFFNKIDAAWKGKGEKNERFGRGVEGPTFGSANESIQEANRNLSKKDAEHLIYHLKDKNTSQILSFVFKVYDFKNQEAKKDMAQAYIHYKDGTIDEKELADKLFQIDKKYEKKYNFDESVNEEIKVGSSVVVNYPTLKKPVMGKVKHILKSPTGLVYVLDGDKGVWDAKNVSEK